MILQSFFFYYCRILLFYYSFFFYYCFFSCDSFLPIRFLKVILQLLFTVTLPSVIQSLTRRNSLQRCSKHIRESKLFHRYFDFTECFFFVSNFTKKVLNRSKYNFQSSKVWPENFLVISQGVPVYYGYFSRTSLVIFFKGKYILLLLL